MKFSVSLDQRNYLNNHGFVPFFNILNESERVLLKGSIPKETSFTKGRDLWRTSPAIKQIVFSKRLIDLVFSLTQKKPIRLGFDQYIPEKGDLKKVFGEELLQNRSSINPLKGLFLIDLNSGDGYFVLPSCPLFNESLEDHPYFLIGYGDQHSQYLYEERDPQLHFLKSLGYVFGDKLNDELHPILLR